MNMAKHLQNSRRRFLGVAATTIAAAGLGMISFARSQSGKKDGSTNTPSSKPPVSDPSSNLHSSNLHSSNLHSTNLHSSNLPSPQNVLNSLKDANGWINSAPLSATSLAGKIILIDFCTYSCIN